MSEFIAIEGLDGAGKTMTVKAIEEEFDVKTTSEPSDQWTGEQVRKALRQDTSSFVDFFLFMADRHAHIENFIKPNLRGGNDVITDRYSLSTLAYQPVQLHDEMPNTDTMSWIREVMHPWQFPPSLTIYLDVGVDTGIHRCAEDEKYENREMLALVRENYNRLIEREDAFTDYEVVDAEQTREEVKNDVFDILEEYL